MSDFFDSVDMDQLMAGLGQDYAFATTPAFHEPVHQDPACHDPFNVGSVEFDSTCHEPVSHGGEAIPLDPQTAFIDMHGWSNFPGFDMPLIDQYGGLGSFTNNQGGEPSTDFLGDLDNPQSATDTSFMDLLPAIGYEDGHVSMPELGSAASLDQKLCVGVHAFRSGKWPSIHSDEMSIATMFSPAGTDNGKFMMPAGNDGDGTPSRLMSPIPLQCSTYDRGFDSDYLLNWRLSTEGHVVRCRHVGCDKPFDTFTEREAHEKRHHIQGHGRMDLESHLTCDDCGDSFPSKARLEQHANEALHSPFHCICGKNFARLDVLHRHLDSLGDGTPKHPCPFCKKHRGDKGFKRKDHLVQHIRGYHKFEAEGRVDILPSRRGRYQTPPVCPHRECPSYRDDSFKKLSIEEQENTHPFPTQSEFTRHMKTVHDYTPFPCTVAGCSKIGKRGYAREKDLINHRKKEHPEAAVYVPEARDVRITCRRCGNKLGPNSMLWHKCQS